MCDEIKAFRSCFTKLRVNLVHTQKLELINKELTKFNLNLSHVMRECFHKYSFELDEAKTWIDTNVMHSCQRVEQLIKDKKIKKKYHTLMCLECIKNSDLTDTELIDRVKQLNMIKENERQIKIVCRIYNLNYEDYKTYTLEQLKEICENNDPANDIIQTFSSRPSSPIEHLSTYNTPESPTLSPLCSSPVDNFENSQLQSQPQDDEKKQKFRTYQRKRNLCYNYGLDFHTYRDLSEDELKDLVQQVKKQRLEVKTTQHDTLRKQALSQNEQLKLAFDNMIKENNYTSVLTSNVEKMFNKRPLSFIEEILRERKDREILLKSNLKQNDLQGFWTLPCAQDYILYEKYKLKDVLQMIEQISSIQVQLR